MLLVNRSQSVSHIVSYRLFSLIHMIRRVWHAILAIWLHYWTNPIYLSWHASLACYGFAALSCIVGLVGITDLIGIIGIIPLSGWSTKKLCICLLMARCAGMTGFVNSHCVLGSSVFKMQVVFVGVCNTFLCLCTTHQNSHICAHCVGTSCLSTYRFAHCAETSCLRVLVFCACLSLCALR